MNTSEKLLFLMRKKNIKNPKELSEQLTKQDLKIPYTTLLTIINNEVQDIKLGTAKKLCVFFNITLDDLLDDSIELNNNEIDNFRYASYGGEDEELDEKDKEKIRAFVEFLKTQKKPKKNNED